MLRTIDGIEYMEGTSEGSLYPVIFWHQNRGHFGVKFQMQSINKNAIAFVLYARIQFFGDDGVPFTPDLEAACQAAGKFRLNASSGKHLSGQILSSIAPLDQLGETPEEQGESFGGAVVDIFKQLHAATPGQSKLKDEYIHQIARKAFWDHVGYDPQAKTTKTPEVTDVPDVEDALDNDFDFTSMMGKISKN